MPEFLTDLTDHRLFWCLTREGATAREPVASWGSHCCNTPMLVTIDARSTTILTIELASDRSADTWRGHCEALEAHHFFSLGMASERGLGLVAGYRAACDMALWVVDYFHEFRDLFALQQQLERKAYAAMAQEDDAAHKFDHAKSASNLAQRLHQYEPAHHACQQAIALDDQLALLLH